MKLFVFFLRSVMRTKVMCNTENRLLNTFYWKLSTSAAKRIKMCRRFTVMNSLAVRRFSAGFQILRREDRQWGMSNIWNVLLNAQTSSNLDKTRRIIVNHKLITSKSEAYNVCGKSIFRKTTSFCCMIMLPWVL